MQTRLPFVLRTSYFALALAALAASAQVPCKWTVDLSRASPANWDCLRGETLELTPSFVSGRGAADLSGVSSATLYWQTNGMGAAYWSRPASVDTNSRPHRLVARWTPDCDCGAQAYAYFVGASAPSGIQYRAFGTVRMRGAPGAAPNALPLPVPILDFARVAVTNAPWGEGGPTTNDVRAIVADATNGVAMAEEVSQEISGAIAEAVLWVAQEYVQNIELEQMGLTNSLGSAAYADASDFATAADEALIYQLMMGSNVVAEVTNYNSSVRSPQLRLLQLVSNEYVTVWAETNGLSRTLAAASAHADGAVAAASNALAAAKADRAWSRHTSGLGADAPAGVTWISTPETVIAGGYEYAKRVTSHGEVWVLSSNGLGLGADTNAYFRVTDGAGETLFSIEKTDAMLVGVDADGINVAGGVVTIPLGVVSQDPPVCYAATSLVNAQWADLAETTPAWVSSASVTGGPGAWVWTVETTAPATFFQFRVMQEGSTVIRNNAQTDLSQGILVNGTRFHPHVSNGTLTWTTTP